MLFDISGRRHTAVRAVYGGLAVVFLAGFIGFGVGSDVSGGLFGSGHGGFHHRGAVSLDDQRDRLQRAVETRPGDAQAWRQLSLLEAQAAYEPSPHHGGAGTLAPYGRDHLNESVSAYERYRDLVGRHRVDRAAGQTAARSYAALGLVRDAIDAQWLVTSRRDVAGHFLVAQLAAASGDDRLLERAMRQALAAATPAQAAQLKAQLPLLRRQAVTVPPLSGARARSAPGA
jgi:hypothetical protein